MPEVFFRASAALRFLLRDWICRLRAQRASPLDDFAAALVEMAAA
jgi:hypothetical protein